MRMSGGHPLAAGLDGGNSLRGEAEATSPPVGVPITAALKNRGIATPVCAPVRDDRLF